MAAAEPLAPPYVRGMMPASATPEGEARTLRPGGGALTGRAIDAGRWRAGDRVLDLGCGTGEGLRQLRQRGIRAIGLDGAMPPGVSETVVMGRAETLPFASQSFDGVLAECSLSVMDDAETALAEVARVLKPGAMLVATDMYARSPVPETESLPRCLRGMVDCGEWCWRLARAGLTPEFWEDHTNQLKQLIGQVLFEYGSLEPLWGCAPSGAADTTATLDAIRRLRPGYLLMAAAKGA